MVAQHQRKDAERVRKFGHVRPPIVIDRQGHKVVAVGKRLFVDKGWKTFHDFLISGYISTVMGGREWGNPEIGKPYEERHPILQWYHHVCDFQVKHATPDREIYSATTTGPVMAYLALAYDLYTLEHHALLQEKLVKRLKNKAQFQGARYETYVAAAFVRAGFDVVLEDESDRSTTHCEFVATHRATGTRYSVEAKSRHRPGFLGQPGAAPEVKGIEADISSLLVQALRKRAEHERVVFIDVNVPPQKGSLFESDWFRKAASQVRRLETTLRGADMLPPAFVFLTNSPYHYVPPDVDEPGKAVVFTAIHMPEFKQIDGDDGSRASEEITRRHPAIRELFDSVLRHTEVPHEI
ncbi:MAG: hypothetical protein HY682_07125 [Chloroflexi bacterium]|nr:hypothetical protein [Chloroflexota bacterium]